MSFIQSTIFTGKNLIRLESVDSTNTFAQELISKTKPIDGTVILADEQTKGKGQQGNSWHAVKEESLTFSLIYDTSFLRVENQYQLNMAVTLGVLKGLTNTVNAKNEFKVKWPNDIYYQQKKLGGILIENSISGHHLKYSTIGIGINLLQSKFPSQLPNPISLIQASEEKITLEKSLDFILVGIEHYFLKLRGNSLIDFKEEYLKKLLGFQKEMKFSNEASQTQFRGTIINVDDIGRLIIDTQDQQKTFANQEVAFLFG